MTNFLPSRAICLLKLNRFAEAKQDCDSALQLDPANKKAFYRRALAFKALQVPNTSLSHLLNWTDLHVYSLILIFCAPVVTSQDYLSASSDLQEVLQLDPKVGEAEQELEVVTGLLRQSLMDNAAHTPRVRGQKFFITHLLQLHP